ncbi:MAG TPA: hypothetical protein VIM65_23060 [Cyclobacteriaceae bacterium]
MKKILICLLVAILQTSICFSQEIHFPMFLDSTKTFQNHILNQLVTKKYKICNTSIGIIKFTVDKHGNTNSIVVSDVFPDVIKEDLFSIVKASKWTPMKKRKKAIESIPLVLPVYISIETDCKEGDIKRQFGFEKKFRELIKPIEQDEYINCLLLRPLTFVVPAGFQDLNPN